MSDDVKEAMEEVMREARGVEERWAEHWLLSAVKLAKHIEAEHQAQAEREAEEGLAVTEEWLRSIVDECSEDGFCIEDANLNAMVNFFETHHRGIWGAQIGDNWSAWPNDLRTRGDVYRLCAALGIPLNAKTPPDPAT